jgi:hypothetical protein
MRLQRGTMLLFLALGGADHAAAANRFSIAAGAVSACRPRHEVLVLCDNDVSILGFSLALKYEPSKLEVLEVMNANTAAEEAEFFEGRIDAAAGRVAYGCVFDTGVAEGRLLGPGTEQPIARLLIELAAGAAGDATIDFETAPPSSPEGTPVRNVMTDEDGFSIVPELEPGVLTLEERAPEITGFEGNAGHPDTVFQVLGLHFAELGLRVRVGGEEAPASLRADGITLDVTAPRSCEEGPVEVEVCSDCGCDADPAGFTYEREYPEALACRIEGQDVFLEWEQPHALDALVILRDGTPLPQEGQSLNSYRDAGAPCGRRTYQLATTLCGVPDPEPPSCSIDVPCPEGAFVRGDVNSDGQINISDAVRIFGWLFTGGPQPECMDAADVNDDGGAALNITDGIFLLDWLFRGGAIPLPPSPTNPDYGTADCALDPTPDGLDCAIGSPKCS